MLGSLGRMFVEVGANLDGLKKGLAEAEGVVKGFGEVVQKHGKAIGAAMTGIGVSSLAITYKSTSAFANFDQAMMNTQSIAVGTSDQFDAMRKQALQMSATMPHSAAEIANGYYYLASAGLDANNIIKVTPTALKLVE